jgi:hypothetical protein
VPLPPPRCPWGSRPSGWFPTLSNLTNRNCGRSTPVPLHLLPSLNHMTLCFDSYQQVYDARALRVIVDDDGGRRQAEAIAACYKLLPAVHRLFRRVHGEEDDYIAQPKVGGMGTVFLLCMGGDVGGRGAFLPLYTGLSLEGALARPCCPFHAAARLAGPQSSSPFLLPASLPPPPRSPPATSHCTRRWWGPGGCRWRCRCAPPPCTRMQSTVRRYRCGHCDVPACSSPCASTCRSCQGGCDGCNGRGGAGGVQAPSVQGAAALWVCRQGLATW